jgi:hypothetical protein
MKTPKLSDLMPDTIMAQIPEDGKSVGVWHPTASGWSVEYVKKELVDNQVDNEWFFRWASRAVADGRYEEAINVIFNHPANPYYDNNPWKDKK